MLKIIFFSTLLTLVFSWDECKNSAKLIGRGLFKRSPEKYYASQADKFVGTLVMLAAIPIGLVYFLASDREMVYKLWILALELLAVALVSKGVEIFIHRVKIAQRYEGREKLAPMVFSFFGLFSPLFRPFSGADGQQRKILAKFAFYLSLPALAGLALKYFAGWEGRRGIIFPNVDIGIVVLIGSLFIRITIDFMEYAFKFYGLERLFSYYRVALGVGLAVLMLAG